MLSVTETSGRAVNFYILLVEDDPIVHQIHRKKLENLGCIVDSAINAKEALEKSKNPYDLILLDWGLPDLDGVEVCKRVRNHEQANELRRVPIAMITAYPKTFETAQECHDAGIDMLYVKPILEESIWEILLNINNDQ